RRLRIVIRLLAHRIDGGPREARVEPPGGDIASHQRLFELSAVDPQIGALHVVGGQPCVVVELGRDLRLALGAQGRARRQRLQIVGQGEILHLSQQGLERRGLIGKLVVIPGRGGVRGQRQYVRQVYRGVELRLIDTGVEVQYL